MDNKDLKKLLDRCDVFVNANEQDKLTFYFFFNTIQKDFELRNYELEKIIEKIMKNSNKYNSYHTIFSLLYEYDYQIKKLIGSPNFDMLLQKYNGVQLCLPNLELSQDNSSLSGHIYSKLTNRKNLFRHEISCNEAFDALRVLVRYLTKCKYRMTSISNNTRHIGSRKLEMVMDESFDMDGYKYENYDYDAKEQILNAKIFKLLLENNKYEEKDFVDLLTFFYCREDMLRLEIIKQLKPELLTLNLTQLIKIIFYGRRLALQFVIDNIPDQFKQIVDQYNPFNIELLKEHGKSSEDKVIRYIDDIWNGWNWYNDECDKPHIGSNDFDKVFEIIKANSTHALDNDTIKLWLKIVLKHDEGYFIKKDKLMSILSLDLNTKAGIIQAVEMVGYSSVWTMLKEQNSDVLKMLLE
jgi:hypothetical protein